jgi:hypothetical protein
MGMEDIILDRIGFGGVKELEEKIMALLEEVEVKTHKSKIVTNK